MLQKLKCPQSRVLPFPSIRFSETKTESFRQKDSIQQIWIMKRFGSLMRGMACSQITGAIMAFLATKMVGHLFENLFSNKAKKPFVRRPFWRLAVWTPFFGI